MAKWLLSHNLQMLQIQANAASIMAFLWTGLWTVAFRPQISRDTPKTRSRNDNQSAPTFGFIHVWRPIAHTCRIAMDIFVHGKACSRCKECRNKGIQETILLQQNYPRRTVQLSLRVYVRSGVLTAIIRNAAVSWGSTSAGSQMDTLPSFHVNLLQQATGSSESLVPTDQPSAGHQIRQPCFRVSAKQTRSRYEHLNSDREGTFQYNGTTDWLSGYLNDSLTHSVINTTGHSPWKANRFSATQ
jgi:hypothetical protein